MLKKQCFPEQGLFLGEIHQPRSSYNSNIQILASMSKHEQTPEAPDGDVKADSKFLGNKHIMNETDGDSKGMLRDRK